MPRRKTYPPYDLSPPALEFLDRLQAARWFSRVALPLDEWEHQHRPIAVCDWAECCRCCESIEWENITLEQQNTHTVMLSRRDPQLLNKTWNRVVASVKEKLELVVDDKLARLALDAAPLKAVRDMARWNLTLAVVETELAESLESEFFRSLAEWYIHGRHPCGWGVIRGGSLELLGPPEGEEWNPRNPDFLSVVLNWPVLSMFKKVVLPEGKLIVY